MDLINKLSEKLDLSSQEINERLNLKQDAKPLEILNALGIYSVFETKEALTEYIGNKLNNKEHEINQLKEALTKKEQETLTLSEQLAKASDKVNKIVQSEINKIQFANKVDVNQLDLNELDFDNLNLSIIKQGKKLNWEVKEETKEKPKTFKYWPNGIITKY
ncbi:hypothetical protein [Mycoplasma buteonis]|uniref:hypothetical protein n=1 Tax=Mycoplasma buteonis TaxID=171280 RepID=UPI0005652862|nr:hypothetical protein [Mycoplasma buteonis]